MKAQYQGLRITIFIVEGYNSMIIKKRKEVQQWLQQCLIGPFFEKEDDGLPVRPSEFYACGYIFGQKEDNNENEKNDETLQDNNSDDEFEVEDRDGNEKNKKETESTSKTCRYKPPSAVGLSFFVSSDIELEIELKGARYTFENPDSSDDRNNRNKKWCRRQLPAGSDEFEYITIEPSQNDQNLEKTIAVLEDDELPDTCTKLNNHSSELSVKWRPYSSDKYTGYIVTISIVNTVLSESYRYEDWEHTHLFQLNFQCLRKKGKIYPYQRNEISNLNDEEKELELLYNDKTIYAIGHSVSPDWIFEENDNSSVKSIKADFMPSVEVPQMMFTIEGLDSDTFNLQKLKTTEENIEEVQKLLYNFSNKYKQWIEALEEKSKLLTEDEQDPANNLISRLNGNYIRVNKGIELLKNTDVARSFTLAHQVMLEYMQIRGVKNPTWRPFQLAFLLLTMPSLIDNNDEYRDTVDLLWFQTGGGKTEAYLAIISFLICYRRIKYPDSCNGTTIIMRYTLRLLTIQQFQRASILISCLELLRRNMPDILGSEPITTGLWVGGNSSPNNYRSAVDIIETAIHNNNNNKGLEQLVITECPYCNKPFDAKYNYETGQDRFNFKCNNQECLFGKSNNQILPINVVDDNLYDNPPTLLLGTVDKFAMFAWNERAGNFFGINGNAPPDLIIQDELHLISGELGSISGVYEAAFDTVFALKDYCPKYIASTATICNAKEQVRRLYARDINIFPPSGLNWSDSFFAKVDNSKPGRLYIGYHSPFLPRTRSFAPLGASLLTAPPLWNTDEEYIIDAWWTLVAYHGSLKGLGITQTLWNDDVSKFIQFYLLGLEKDESFTNFIKNKDTVRQKNQTFKIFTDWRRLYNGVVQLTSNRTPSEIRRYLGELEQNFEHKNNLAISGLLCTNMVSVGLDISRLGLMVINGQPFTTGEYIQASSRVGRSDVPGIVVAHYYKNNARDLSHFENFRAYHESFYRFVEPTTLTPFSTPTIKRALHAALIIVMRYGVNGLRKNAEACKFDINDEKVINAISKLKTRCKNASKEASNNIDYYIKKLVQEWHDNRGGRFSPVTYKKISRSQPLIISHNTDINNLNDFPWKTLQSMRQVDGECGIRFTGSRKIEQTGDNNA